MKKFVAKFTVILAQSMMILTHYTKTAYKHCIYYCYVKLILRQLWRSLYIRKKVVTVLKTNF